MSSQNDRNAQRPLEGRVDYRESNPSHSEPNAGNDSTFWGTLLGWMDTLSTTYDRPVTYDNLTRNVFLKHRSPRISDTSSSIPELPNRPIPANSSPLLKGSIQRRLQQLQVNEQKRLDAALDRNSKKQTSLNYLGKTSKRIQPENDQTFSMESYEPTRNLDAEALLRQQLNSDSTAPELLEMSRKDYRQFVQRPLNAADYLKSLQGNVVVEPSLNPVELLFQIQRNHKKSESVGNVSQSKSTNDRNQNNLWGKLKAGQILSDSEMKQLFHTLDLQKYAAATDAERQNAEFLRLYAEQQLAENVVKQAPRTTEGDVLIQNVPVRPEDALYFAKLDIQHFQETDFHIKPDQLEALRLTRMSGRYMKRTSTKRPKILKASMSERFRQLSTTGGAFKPILRAVVPLEKQLAKAYPSHNSYLRGQYANLAEQSAGLRTQRGQAPLTKAGNALMKHGNRLGTVFPKPNGNNQAINQQAQAIVEDILFDEATVMIKVPNRNLNLYPKYKQFIDIISDFNTGPGVRYGLTSSGKLEFVGFREP